MFDVTTWVTLAVGGVLILLGLALYAAIQTLRARNASAAAPNLTLDAVLHALEGHFYKAILAGERTILWGLDEIDAQINSADKKAVADSFYSLLPDVIVINGAPVPLRIIKAFVPREVFEARVKDLYDEADAFIKAREAYLRDQVDALKFDGAAAAQHTQ